MACPVHALLVKAVSELQAVNTYYDDMWLSFCHDWNDEPDWNQGHLTRDPFKYTTSFLGHFLQHVAQNHNNPEIFGEYIHRCVKKIPRLEPRYQELVLRGVNVNRVWICVGQAELSNTPRVCNGRYSEVWVKLGSTSIVHSGSAVSMFVHCLDCGLFSMKFGCTLAPMVHLNCIHYEGKFDHYPQPDDPPHFNRMDNINNVFRAFGVDAGSTQQIFGNYKGRFVDPRLEHFVAVGTKKYGSRPCFDIVPGKFIDHLTKQKTKVLQESLFVKEVSNRNPKIKNGINRWTLHRECDVVHEVVNYYGHNDPSTVVVHLDPKGTNLIVDDKYFDCDGVMRK